MSRAGLLDEIVLHMAPVLLGGGVRLFGDEGSGRIELERISVGEAEQLTDLRFRVVKEVASRAHPGGNWCVCCPYGNKGAIPSPASVTWAGYVTFSTRAMASSGMSA